MSEQHMVSSIELGSYLAQMRERAGIKQAELARLVAWSPAMLSRIENGDRPIEPHELDQLLDAISTPEAQQLKVVLSREWKVLNRPELDHPDQDLLWSAEQISNRLVVLANQPDTKKAFERRIFTYLNEIQSLTNLLLKREHQIAFIGSVGIGKSTAICRLSKLEIATPNSLRLMPVLEAGPGRTTICEVHVSRGPGYGLMIEPRSDEEIRADVTDFAEYILGNEDSINKEGIEENAQSISKEIERAIRNLSGLNSRQEKGADGKKISFDKAKDLAKNFSNTKDLVIEILSRMELHCRNRRDIWHGSSNSGKQPLEWLKETFEKINNGRHPEFTLPRRIEVIVPTPLLPIHDLFIRLIDTKGIDHTAARADLEGLLDDSHTLAVLCSNFASAPTAEIRLLLKRAKESGIRELQDKIALLVLPRYDEALTVKDDSGQLVESIDEGYGLKEEQILMSLSKDGMKDLSVAFFNSHQDDSTRFSEFLKERVFHSRKNFQRRLHEILDNANTLLLNYRQEQTQAVIRQVGSQLQTWIQRHRTISRKSGHVQKDLLSQIARAYAATVRASVNREGNWHNLNYSYLLGSGARHIAVQSLGSAVQGFSEVCQNLAATPEFQEAKELVTQAERLLILAYDELLVKVQLMGETSFRDELKLDKKFWISCQNEWGRGSGYKDRVTNHNHDWFGQSERLELENQIIGMIQREWEAALTRVGALLCTDE